MFHVLHHMTKRSQGRGLGTDFEMNVTRAIQAVEPVVPAGSTLQLVLAAIIGVAVTWTVMECLISVTGLASVLLLNIVI